MKKKIKRMLALLLCLTMCFGVASPALAAYYAAGTVVEDDDTDEIAAGTVVDEDSEGEYFAPPTAGSVIETDGEAVNVDEPVREIDPSIPVTQEDEFPEPRVVEITAESLESGVSAVAAKSATLFIQDANVLAPAASSMSGFTILGGSNFHNTYPKIVKYSDGTVAAGYCADQHASLPSLGNGGMGSGSPNFSAEEQTLCGDIMALGYQQTSGTSIPTADRYKWLITQMVIWSVRCGTVSRDTKTGALKFSATGVSSITDYCQQIGKLADYVGGGQYTAFYEYAYSLVYGLNYIRRLPDFMKASEIEAKRNAIKLELDSSTNLYKTNKELVSGKSAQYYVYINKLIANGVITSDFDITGGHGIDGLSVAISGDNGSGYKAYFSKTDGITAASSPLTRNIKGGSGSVLCWKDGSGYTQQILTSNYGNDKVTAYFAVGGNVSTNVESGVHKESEDGIVSGIPFTFTGGGQSFTLTTDSNGDIDVSSLPKYETYEKTDEAGNGTGVFIEDTTKPITYTVTEVTPIRYVQPASQTICPARGGSISFENRLKKWRVTVSKRDSETGYSQGDATLSGAAYGLYKDGTLIDTYYTNSLGRFTTDYYPCGSGYTLQEISPSTGYLINATAYSVGLNPAQTSIEYNDTTATVTEQVIKGKVKITKHTDKGETGVETPEDGAKFEVFLSNSGSYENARAAERDIITTDGDGTGETKLLPYGFYTVHQIDGWEGKEFVNDFQVFISENGKTYAFILNNRVFEALVTIMKKDSESGKTIPVSGIGFKIRNADTGQYVVQHINYPTPQDLSVFYTDVTGKLMMPEKLNYGNYELIEVATAYGYVLNDEPVPFVVDGTLKEVVVTKYNTPQKGIINISKTGEIFESVIQNDDGEYVPVYAEKGLEGAVFEIIAADDIYTSDNTLRYVMGEVVDTITTNSSGLAASIPLYLGKYTVKEKTAPEGFVRSSEYKTVVLSYAGQTVDITNLSLNLSNKRQKAVVNAFKKMERDEDFGIGIFVRAATP